VKRQEMKTCIKPSNRPPRTSRLPQTRSTTGCSHKPAELIGKRWKAVRLGLRLANSHLGIGVIVWFYVLWCLIGLLLSVLGAMGSFKNALNPLTLYGFVLPMALAAAATWAVKLFSRFLWCAIPEPLSAKCLAFASVAGRLSVLYAIGFVWLSGGPFGKGLLLPATVACSGIGWLGLLAEWGFIRTLRRDFMPAADPAPSSDEVDHSVESATEAEAVPEQHKKSILTRDFGAWFSECFPKAHKVIVWVILPLAYVTASSLADNGNLQAVPAAILRLAVIAPALLQVFTALD
jgi:hypothetical protein